MSESDYPFDIVYWENASQAPFTTDAPNQRVEYFFRNVAEEKEWHSPAQKALVSRFQSLIQTISEHLRDATVYRIGETQVEAYIVGKLSDGGIGGLHTTLIET